MPNECFVAFVAQSINFLLGFYPPPKTTKTLNKCIQRNITDDCKRAFAHMLTLTVEKGNDDNTSDHCYQP